MRTWRRLSLFVIAAATLALAGIAFAFLTADGAGSGSGSSPAAILDVTLSPATASSELFPGGSADVALTVSNPNVSPSHLDSLVLDTSAGTEGFSVDGGHSGCDVSTLSFNGPQDNGGDGWDVPVSDGTTDGTLPLSLTGAISMGSDADDACQGAQFTVYLKAGP